MVISMKIFADIQLLSLTLVITAQRSCTLHPLCYREDGGAVVAGVLVAGRIFALPRCNREGS